MLAGRFKPIPVERRAIILRKLTLARGAADAASGP